MLSNAYFLNNNLILKLAIPNLDMVKEATTKEDTTKAGETNQLTKVGEINLRIKAGETNHLTKAGETNHLTKEATTKEDILARAGEINLRIKVGARTINLGVRQVLGVGEVEV